MKSQDEQGETKKQFLTSLTTQLEQKPEADEATKIQTPSSYPLSLEQTYHIQLTTRQFFMN